MDFKDLIFQLSERVQKLKESIQTEEATKNAFVMPMLNALGYDIFNPMEVVPEYTCDIGTKKGEKIDYAILKEDKAIILIECKCWNQNLTLHDNQLLRYFNVSNARFGVLTNGIKYKFYTDLVSPNQMDNKPFLEIDLEDPKSDQIEELKKFHKSYFDIDLILNTASELKYTNEFKQVLIREFNEPSDKFIQFMGKEVYDGILSPKLREQFSPLIKKSFAAFVNEKISDRLNAAMKDRDNSDVEDDEEPVEEEKSLIETTEDELNGFYVVKSILRGSIDLDRVQYKDVQSYFGINIDGSVRKTFVRLRFNNPENLRIEIGSNQKRIPIDKIDDIYNFSEQIIEEAKNIIEGKSVKSTDVD